MTGTIKDTSTGVPSQRYLIAVGLVTAALAGSLIGTALTLATPVPGIPQPSTGVAVGLTVSRVVLDLAAVVTVGFSLLPLLIGMQRIGGAERTLAAVRPLAAASALLWSLAALVSLMLLAVEYDPDRPFSVAAVVDYVRQVSSGQGMAIVVVAAFGHALLGAVTIRRGERVPAELRLALALFALLPLPVTGHAADTGPVLQDASLVSIELHVLAAVAWTGGLLAVVTTLAGSRSLLASTLPRFSKLAGVALLTVLLTGSFTGWFVLYQTPGVDVLTALFTTGYGQVLLGKLLCGVALAALGGQVRFRLLPRIVRHQKSALLAWVGFELTVMGLAFGLAAVLTRTPVVS